MDPVEIDKIFSFDVGTEKFVQETIDENEVSKRVQYVEKWLENLVIDRLAIKDLNSLRDLVKVAFEDTFVIVLENSLKSKNHVKFEFILAVLNKLSSQSSENIRLRLNRVLKQEFLLGSYVLPIEIIVAADKYVKSNFNQSLVSQIVEKYSEYYQKFFSQQIGEIQRRYILRFFAKRSEKIVKVKGKFFYSIF